MAKPDIDNRAVAGLLSRGKKLLVIERSQTVIAPGKLCFPGGQIENDETIEIALRREYQEELNLDVWPKKQIWECVTSWKCHVHWWLVSCPTTETLQANPGEVAAWSWMTVSELLSDVRLLSSNRQFLEEVESGEINLWGAFEAMGDG